MRGGLAALYIHRSVRSFSIVNSPDAETSQRNSLKKGSVPKSQRMEELKEITSFLAIIKDVSS
jgi:hypothetical protein